MAHRSETTRTVILEAIHGFVSEHGTPPREEDFMGRGFPWFTTCHRLFGSFAEAVRVAGYEPRQAGYQRRKVAA